MKSSDSVLRRVRAALADRYFATAIRRDRQAISVHFDGGRITVDVVPATYNRASAGGYPSFLIPDGTGGWLDTSPALHNARINAADVRSGGKLKNVARLVKRWRVRRQKPIRLTSIYLELLLAAENVCRVGMTYEQCLLASFGLLHGSSCAPIDDPAGLRVSVSAASTDASLDDLRNAIEFAYDHATRACEASARKRYGEAVRQWRIVFGERS